MIICNNVNNYLELSSTYLLDWPKQTFWSGYFNFLITTDSFLNYFPENILYCDKYLYHKATCTLIEDFINTIRLKNIPSVNIK